MCLVSFIEVRSLSLIMFLVGSMRSIQYNIDASIYERVGVPNNQIIVICYIGIWGDYNLIICFEEFLGSYDGKGFIL